MIHAKQNRILLAGHEDGLRHALTEQLTANGGWEVVEALPCDLALLGGAEACSNVRNDGFVGPIMLLVGSEYTDGESLATEVMKKPVKMGTLIGRLKTLLSNAEKDERAKYRIGSYYFHEHTQRLVDVKSGHTVMLTEKETAILSILRKAKGEAIDREKLLSLVWGYVQGIDTHTLETHIYRLRRKIESNSVTAEIIITDNGGYKLAT